MERIWVWSDPHFGHSNILKFTSYENGPRIRPEFTNVEEMNESIVRNYNELVRPEDIVYCLGDLGWHKPTLDKVLPRLMGRKRLILGNHDTLDVRYYRQFFDKVLSERFFSNKDSGLKNNYILCHFPLHKASFAYKPNCYNVHGHTHEKDVMIDGTKIKDPVYINVSVEKTEYKPVLLSDIDKRL